MNVMVVPMTAPVTDLNFIRAAYLDKAKNIAVEASVATEREATEWLSELDILNQRGQFFSSLTIYCVKGHKK